MQVTPLLYDGGEPVLNEDGKPTPPTGTGCGGCLIVPIVFFLIALAIWYAYQ